MSKGEGQRKPTFPRSEHKTVPVVDDHDLSIAQVGDLPMLILVDSGLPVFPAGRVSRGMSEGQEGTL